MRQMAHHDPMRQTVQHRTKTTLPLDRRPWQRYEDRYGDRPHTVQGDVWVLPEVYSPQLGNHRDILVYLPPSYHGSERRYPVIYMHDGQNLFDAHTSFAGEWGVDKALDRLAQEGIEAIVVGIPNQGAERIQEYTPFVDRRHGGGKGQAYVDFVAETVKPLIDQSFRTRPEPEETVIMGSSLGGLVSLYAGFYRPQVFGKVGAMSPSVWFAGGALLTYIRDARGGPRRIYVDMGTQEEPRPRWARWPLLAGLYRTPTERLVALLERKGYRQNQTLKVVWDPEGRHNEASWARRLPDALRFLLALSGR